MRRSWLLLFLLLVVPLGAAACSDDGDDDEAGTTTSAVVDASETVETVATDDDSSPDDTTSVPADDDALDAEGPEPPTDDFPCDLVPTSAVVDATGQSFTEGETTLTHNTRNAETWTSFRCSWEGDGVDQEVTVDVTFAEGFPSGSVDCPEASIDAVEVDGAGEQTYWEWEGPLKQAALQECTAEALVEVVADTWSPDDEPGAQAALLALAALAIAGS